MYEQFLLLLISLVAVTSMSIKGSVLTRYDPCSNGGLHFEKITSKLWKGIIDFDMYRIGVVSEIAISFNESIFIQVASNKSTVTEYNNVHDFRLKFEGKLPKTYEFYALSINPNDEQNYVPTVTKYSINNVTLCDETIRISEGIEALNVTKKNDTMYRHVCGRRSLRNAELMTLRSNSTIGDWPWHVAIMVEHPDTKLFKYQCGGNIISPSAILTAGHCLFLSDVEVKPNKIVVEAGLTNLAQSDPSSTRVAQRTILHPGYSHELATSDLAIIIVKTLRFTEYVQPICIWGPTYDKKALYGKEAVVVGFGTTEQNVLSDTLRATNIVVQSDASCIAYSADLYKKLLNEFTFCAGSTSGNSPRNGDSGGGLIVPTLQSDYKITWFLRGVLSKCGRVPPNELCDPSYFVVYTDVGPHYSWIYHNAELAYRSNIVAK